MQMHTYLFFDGNCAEAFKFYEKTMGGKIGAMLTYADSPGADHVSAGWKSKIIHANITIGETVLMASDAPPERSPGRPQGFSVSLSADTPAEAERIFAALAEKGTVSMAMGETFFAHRFGSCTDRFGIPWMVICEKAH